MKASTFLLLLGSSWRGLLSGESIRLGIALYDDDLVAALS